MGDGWSCRSPWGDPAYRDAADAALQHLDAPASLPSQPPSGSSNNPHPHFLKDRFWHCISNLAGVVWATSGNPHALFGK